MILVKDKVAITYKNSQYTYNQLVKYSKAYGEMFSNSAEHLSKVLIFADNCPEYFFATYGALYANAIVLPVDVSLNKKELAYIINDSKPEIIFTMQSKKAFVQETLDAIEPYQNVILVAEDIDLSNLDSYSVENFNIEDPERTLAILYTSGTTGAPKGVMLSMRNIKHNMEAVSDFIPIFNVNTSVMVLLPLHHSLPLIGTMFVTMYSGATAHIAEGLNADAILKTLNEGKVHNLIGVPRLYETLAKGVMTKINSSFAAKMMYGLAGLIGSQSFSKMIFKSVHQKFGGHLKYLVCGGAALPDNVAKVFKTLGFEVLVGYGLTECAPMISFTRPGEVKVGYSGRLIHDMDLKIDPETGEIAVKGPNVMQGYYNKPEETRQILREDGWLYTGDIGTLDKYGLKITGRIKEIIVTSNGKNINPVEIEHEIMEKSAFMKEVAVFLHDDKLHAVVYPDMGFVRLETDATLEDLIKEEIMTYNSNAMSYKKIMQYHISSEELPKTKLGKTQRFKLEEFVSKKERVKEKEDLSDKSQYYILLKEFIEKETGSRANENDHLEIDLNIDSLGRISLISFIETSFGVEIPEYLLDEFCTLKKLADHIEKNATTCNEGGMSWKEILHDERPKNFDMPKSGFIHWFMVHFMKMFFNVFYRFRSTGKENLPTEPTIIIGNHRSGFDGVLVMAKLNWAWAKDIYFFAKMKHFKSRWRRFMARNNNTIVMDINLNVKESMQAMAEVLRQKKHVVIFPEGTRSRDRKLKQFKEAFAILSTELNVPILPVMIRGAENATYDSFRFPKFMSKISLHYSPIIRPQPNETAEELRIRVEELYRKMDN